MSGSLKRVTLLAVQAAALCCCAGSNRKVEPTAIADLSLAGLPGKAVGATVAFVSEDIIAIGRHPGETGELSGTLSVVGWRDGKLGFLNTTSISKYRTFLGGLFPIGNGRFISSLQQPPELLSADLSVITDIQTKFVIPPVRGGNVVGDSHGLRYWNVYQLAPATVLLRQGTGQLLALSDDLLVVRVNNEIKIESMKGQPLGSFAVPPISECYARALLLGPNRLYLNGCGPGRVVDFRGKTIVAIPEPDGWGFRYGSTEDGRRMLFDKYTRRISAVQRMAESVESAITFGMAPIVTSRGEVIRVVDAETGKICLELDSPDRMFGRDGEFHADISPSGHFTAVVSVDKLSIYPVPASCDN
jgi:hypothetical protein